MGATKLYHFLKRLYYCQGTWKEIHQYVRSCQKCQIMNLQTPHYINLHQDITQIPQDHISIDLIGPYNITSQGNSLCPHCGMQPYRLPYDNPHTRKKTATVAIHLFWEIMFKFNFPRILHSNNGTEFKSKLIKHLTKQLSIKKTYISPHYPQANRKSESSHQFIKDCIWYFSIDGTLEWDQLLPYANAAFNWFPMSTPSNHPYFLYFGYNPHLPHLAAFLQPKLRYLGSDKGMIPLHKWRQAYI